MAESRLIGGYPVIGIRPTIDGRRGPLKVRESLDREWEMGRTVVAPDGKTLYSPKEVMVWLEENKPKEELALSHGDYCLPNVF